MLWKKSKLPTTPKGSDLTAFIDEGSEIEGIAFEHNHR